MPTKPAKAAELKNYRVFLFGSRAKGTAHERSDFDIGVIGDEPMDLKLYYQIETELENLPTLYQLEWVDFNRVSPQFKERALEKTRAINES